MTPRRLIVLLACWLLLAVALWASESHPSVLALGGFVAAIGGALYVVVDLARAVTGLEWTRRARRPSTARRADPRGSSMRRTVQGTWWSGSSGIDALLVELVDDRLLAHHGVDRIADPSRAAAVLSPTLRALVETPQRSTRSPRQLQHLLSEIEAL